MSSERGFLSQTKEDSFSVSSATFLVHENTHTKAGESSYLFSWIPDLQRDAAVLNDELQSSKSQNLDLFSQ